MEITRGAFPSVMYYGENKFCALDLWHSKGKPTLRLVFPGKNLARMHDEKTNAKVNTTKDYYYVLGVRPDATTEEIKEAYQELNEKLSPHINISGQDPELIIKPTKTSRTPLRC